MKPIPPPTWELPAIITGNSMSNVSKQIQDLVYHQHFIREFKAVTGKTICLKCTKCLAASITYAIQEYGDGHDILFVYSLRNATDHQLMCNMMESHDDHKIIRRFLDEHFRDTIPTAQNIFTAMQSSPFRQFYGGAFDDYKSIMYTFQREISFRRRPLIPLTDDLSHVIEILKAHPHWSLRQVYYEKYDPNLPTMLYLESDFAEALISQFQDMAILDATFTTDSGHTITAVVVADEENRSHLLALTIRATEDYVSYIPLLLLLAKYAKNCVTIMGDLGGYIDKALNSIQWPEGFCPFQRKKCAWHAYFMNWMTFLSQFFPGEESFYEICRNSVMWDEKIAEIRSLSQENESIARKLELEKKFFTPTQDSFRRGAITSQRSESCNSAWKVEAKLQKDSRLPIVLESILSWSENRWFEAEKRASDVQDGESLSKYAEQVLVGKFAVLYDQYINAREQGDSAMIKRLEEGGWAEDCGLPSLKDTYEREKIPTSEEEEALNLSSFFHDVWRKKSIQMVMQKYHEKQHIQADTYANEDELTTGMYQTWAGQ